MSVTCCGTDVFVTGVRPAKGDVVARCGRKNGHVLGHQCDAGAHRFGVGPGEVNAVDGDATGVRIVEAEEKLEDGTLAGAGGANDCHRLARPHLE